LSCPQAVTGRHSAATRPDPVTRPLLHLNFSNQLLVRNIQFVAMAKSKDKQSAKTESAPKGDKSFIKVDKKTFDPTLASLFASSVRLSTANLQLDSNANALLRQVQ
jgi:hypothetical protein